MYKFKLAVCNCEDTTIARSPNIDMSLRAERSEASQSHYNRGRRNAKKAFTLAEILITLGVIGVTASITMPVLINKYQEHITVNKVKKFYSTFGQAVLLSINENEYPNNWNVSENNIEEGTIDISKYIVPYLKVLKDCGENTGCLNYTEGYKYLSGGLPTSTNYDTDTKYYKLILSDGSYVWFRRSDTSTDYCNFSRFGVDNICALVFTDINGSKSPNQFGRDIFELFITKRGVEAPGHGDCNLKEKGWSCLSHILEYGDMNYPEE